MIRSRTIKFRIWDKKEKRWFHGSTDAHRIAIGTDAINLFGETIVFGELFRDQNTDNMINLPYIENLVVCEYAGYKDVNGTDVYEHDIVEASGMPNSPIEFINGQFHPVYDDDSGDLWEGPIHAFNIRVIGNKLENPELVEVQ